MTRATFLPLAVATGAVGRAAIMSESPHGVLSVPEPGTVPARVR